MASRWDSSFLLGLKRCLGTLLNSPTVWCTPTKIMDYNEDLVWELTNNRAAFASCWFTAPAFSAAYTLRQWQSESAQVRGRQETPHNRTGDTRWEIKLVNCAVASTWVHEESARINVSGWLQRDRGGFTRSYNFSLLIHEVWLPGFSCSSHFSLAVNFRIITRNVHIYRRPSPVKIVFLTCSCGAFLMIQDIYEEN